jgi:hypothetical protein
VNDLDICRIQVAPDVAQTRKGATLRLQIC